MSLASLDRGDKRDIHLNLTEPEIAILDELAARHNSSRSLVVGELLRGYAHTADLSQVAEAVRPDRRATRKEPT